MWVCHQLISHATAPLVNHGLYCEHLMGLLQTPLHQTAEGCLWDLLRASTPVPENRNLVSTILTWSPLYSMPAFHALHLEIHPSWVSAMSISSRSTHDTPMQNSRQSAPNTRMEVNGLRAELCCTPTPTPNSLYWRLTCTHHWSTCPRLHATPIPRHQGSLRSLAHDRWLSQCQWRKSRSVCQRTCSSPAAVKQQRCLYQAQGRIPFFVDIHHLGDVGV